MALKAFPEEIRFFVETFLEWDLPGTETLREMHSSTHFFRE